ncbi:glucose-6-phosphate isomerase family protein [Lacrimispora sp.]|uniref:glucose-6-phosphate isomerase family protein n=1 Tax=Lacrimispora sp. TaxID=2719234 RepID=UPI002FD8AC22
MKITEPKAIHNFYNGVIEGKPVMKSRKLLKDILTAYKDQNHAEDPQRVMYEVYCYEDEDSIGPGSLSWGLTVMYPERVNGECNFTRGHMHEDTSCGEFYFGLAGEGLLLLMDLEGNAWAERVYPNSLHYVRGKLAHRLVNTGDQVLKVGACWPSCAGHNYEWVEKHPFPVRVYKKNGEIVCI